MTVLKPLKFEFTVTVITCKIEYSRSRYIFLIPLVRTVNY